MKNVVVERCCGNCEYSISPENEHDIMIENHYDEDDPTRPRAGDCCLGVEHNGNYVCGYHEYLSGGLETYSFYEEKDLGPGYYVVQTYCDHVIKFFKLYRTGEYGKYSYGIRAGNLYPIEKGRYDSVTFDIEETTDKVLYAAIKYFALVLGDDIVIDFNNNNQMKTEVNKYNVSVIFTSSNLDNKFIDIKLDHNDKDYKLMEFLFRNMAVVTANKKDEEVALKVRKINRK